MRLAGNLRRSVAGLLTRHGVACVEPASIRPPAPEQVVVISADVLPGGCPPREIELRLLAATDSQPPRALRLGLPVLDSNLLEALLALVLEDPGAISSCEKPG